MHRVRAQPADEVHVGLGSSQTRCAAPAALHAWPLHVRSLRMYHWYAQRLATRQTDSIGATCKLVASAAAARAARGTCSAGCALLSVCLVRSGSALSARVVLRDWRRQPRPERRRAALGNERDGLKKRGFAGCCSRVSVAKGGATSLRPLAPGVLSKVAAHVGSHRACCRRPGTPPRRTPGLGCSRRPRHRACR